jgi:hypothetical protein
MGKERQMNNPVIEQAGAELIVKLRWSSFIVPAFAALLAVGVFFFFRSGQIGRSLAAFRTGAEGGFLPKLLAGINFVFIAIATIAVLYAIVRNVNSSELRAGDTLLSARHGPLPWFAPNVELDPATIEGFAIVHRVDRPEPGSQRGSGSVYGGSLDWYKLAVRVSKDGHTSLLGLTPSLENDEALSMAGKALSGRYGKPFSKVEG